MQLKGKTAKRRGAEEISRTSAPPCGRPVNRGSLTAAGFGCGCGQLGEGCGGDGARHPSSSLGSLGVPQGLPSDCGCYKCVAVNRHGVDTLAMEVNVTRRPGPGRGERRSRRPDSGRGL
ncbi:unnamed protein product, partial [Boreogadus saida]